MKDNGIGIWNITFDVDGKLYVLDEGKIGTSVSNIIKLMHDNISMNDIRNTNCRMNLGNGWSIMFLSDISPINKNIKE